MEALLEELTPKRGQKDEKELIRSEERMSPTERNNSCKGLKLHMSIANWYSYEMSSISEGGRREDEIKLELRAGARSWQSPMSSQVTKDAS